MNPSPGNIPYEYRDTTIESLPANWRAEFEAEVNDGNFLRGGKSIMLHGQGAEEASRMFAACLLRGGFPVYRVTPFEVVRRISGKYVMCDSDVRRSEFENAECYLIDDFFFDHSDCMSAEDAYQLWWFMQQCVRDGAVLVIATDNEKIDTIDCYPDYMWEFVEEKFEVIRGAKSEEKKSGGIKKRKTHG